MDFDHYLHFMMNLIRKRGDIKWKTPLEFCRIGLKKYNGGFRFFIAQLLCMLRVVSPNTNDFH
jgi:hypothetical protein